MKSRALSRGIRSACSAWLFGMLLVVDPGAAFAQGAPARAKKAQQLFEEATAELDAGKYDSACPKLLEVTRLAPDGVGARETLAECYEKQGKLASAWRQHGAAEALARKQNKLDRAAAAARHAAALKPRLATLTASAPPGAGEAVLQLDGETVEGAPWGTPVYVDGGSHTVVVTAPGYKPFSRTITVTGDGAKVKLQVPALEAANAAPDATATVTATAATGDTPPPPPESAPSPVNLRFVGGITAVGLGVGSIALGIFSGLQVQSAQTVVDEYRGTIGAGEDLCAEENLATLAASEEQRVKDACGAGAFVPLQFVFYGLGAALAGTGIYLLATSRQKASAAPAWRIQPSVGAHGAWMSVAGHW